MMDQHFKVMNLAALFQDTGVIDQGQGDEKVTVQYDQDGSINDGELVLERKKLAIKPPPLYRVVLLDDDFTPMDFVVEALQQFFAFSREKATEIMLKVHHHGYAVCGLFTKDVAETKASQVLEYAREHQHPLFCRAEPDES